MNFKSWVISLRYISSFCLCKHARPFQQQHSLNQSGAWALEVRKVFYGAFIFSVFWRIRNKWSHWPGGQSAPRLYNHYNLCPCARPAHVWPGPRFKFSTLLTKSKKRNYKELSNMKTICVSALTGSVPRKMAKALQRVSALIKNWTQVARLSPIHLNH